MKYSDPAEITGTPEVSPKPPINEGESINMTCSSDAYPQPPGFVYWNKRGSTEKLGEYRDGITTLTFHKISRKNAGYYKCIANNGIDPEDESKIFEVAVNCKH